MCHPPTLHDGITVVENFFQVLQGFQKVHAFLLSARSTQHTLRVIGLPAEPSCLTFCVECMAMLGEAVKVWIECNFLKDIVCVLAVSQGVDERSVKLK